MRSPVGLFVFVSLLVVSGRSDATPGEEVAASAASSTVMIDQMQSASTEVRHALQAARAQRDVVKVLCLNDKLNQLDVAVRTARERRAELVESTARADVEGVKHHSILLTTLRERSRVLAAEARQCVGQPTPGEPDHVQPVAPPDLPDPTEYPNPDAFAVFVSPGRAVSPVK
jgi:hypothetical protein